MEKEIGPFFDQTVNFRAIVTFCFRDLAKRTVEDVEVGSKRNWAAVIQNIKL